MREPPGLVSTASIPSLLTLENEEMTCLELVVEGTMDGGKIPQSLDIGWIDSERLGQTVDTLIHLPKLSKIQSATLEVHHQFAGWYRMERRCDRPIGRFNVLVLGCQRRPFISILINMRSKEPHLPRCLFTTQIMIT